jgi:formylglycine-generating enzyme required for sulfatase activity
VADVLADCETQLKANAKLEDFSWLRQSKPTPKRLGMWKWVAAAFLVPVLGLVLMEIAGVSHWLRSRQPMSDLSQKVDVERPRVKATANQEIPLDYTNTLGMKFKRIPAGKFSMGSSQEEIDTLRGNTKDEVFKGMLASEGPEHEVEITRPFSMGTTEVTVGQFRQFIAANPKYQVGDDRWERPEFFQADNYPVVWVSWQNAVDFCNWLSEKEGKIYRLPTEAEWEYCCRSGKSGTRYGHGDNDSQLGTYAWYDRHLGDGTHRAGDRKANAWGLYDMHGNVFEWCQDWHDLNYYRNSSRQDPIGPGAGTARVTRGGGWRYQFVHCRSAFRSWLAPQERRDSVGFRVLLVSPAADEPTMSGS